MGVTWNDLDNPCMPTDPITSETGEMEEERFSNTLHNSNEETDDIEWEDGSSHILDPVSNHPGDGGRTVTIEFSESPDSSNRRPVRRATAKEKESAELVHKVHLLCLLARGRIIDYACEDPLIQASLLSILPTHLLKTSEGSKLCAKDLYPVVNWFHDNFRITSSVSKKRTFHSALAFALETREGTLEEIAALSVVLFRALKLTTRFVSILDVASLKPDAERCEPSSQDASRLHAGVFSTSTLTVDRPANIVASPVESFSSREKNVCEPSSKVTCRSKDRIQSKYSSPTVELKSRSMDSLPCEVQDSTSEACTSGGTKRKGDLEFEMQLQMALSATSIATPQRSVGFSLNSSDVDSPFKRIRKNSNEESSSQGISVALGSKKIGSSLYWAEVYCSGENLAGKWVHVDAIHAIVDGEHMVEAAAATCKTSLRYVVSFSGHGAKDVTRRYCMKWYKIASQRIDSVWWDAVMAPLRQLESRATEACPNVPGESGRQVDVDSSGRNSWIATRETLEDMELETRALTEPLPTNQQAYKNHPLYAIERWLTKCQILHPNGPILGFCSGHPVYPRTCVQTLKTKERWLREGMQVKAKELPAKVVKQSGRSKKVQFSDDDYGQDDSKGIVELFGRWQLEPLQLPHAVDGIVPKNGRGQVEVWSEKCLPPGTAHLRLPRVFHVAKRLEIDYAPAMIGFDFKNGRSVPVFDGIVVCTEFKDAILEAYAEEEERRVAKEKKRDEARALSRWYQLLSSIITRQRLKNCYGSGSSLQIPGCIQNPSEMGFCGNRDAHPSECQKEDTWDAKIYPRSVAQTDDHEHVFAEDQSFDEEGSMRTKRCRCGFSVQVERL